MNKLLILVLVLLSSKLVLAEGAPGSPRIDSILEASRVVYTDQMRFVGRTQTSSGGINIEINFVEQQMKNLNCAVPTDLKTFRLEADGTFTYKYVGSGNSQRLVYDVSQLSSCKFIPFCGIHPELKPDYCAQYFRAADSYYIDSLGVCKLLQQSNSCGARGAFDTLAKCNSAVSARFCGGVTPSPPTANLFCGIVPAKAPPCAALFVARDTYFIQKGGIQCVSNSGGSSCRETSMCVLKKQSDSCQARGAFDSLSACQSALSNVSRCSF